MKIILLFLGNRFDKKKIFFVMRSITQKTVQPNSKDILYYWIQFFILSSHILPLPIQNTILLCWPMVRVIPSTRSWLGMRRFFNSPIDSIIVLKLSNQSGRTRLSLKLNCIHTLITWLNYLSNEYMICEIAMRDREKETPHIGEMSKPRAAHACRCHGRWLCKICAVTWKNNRIDRNWLWYI